MGRDMGTVCYPEAEYRHIRNLRGLTGGVRSPSRTLLRLKFPANRENNREFSTERYAVGQFSEGHIRRLPSIENRFHNVGSEKSSFQNPAHVSLVETELLCNGSLTRNFSGHDPFVPLASACHGLQ